MKQNVLINNIVKIETKEKEIFRNVLLVLGGVVFLSLWFHYLILQYQLHLEHLESH